VTRVDELLAELRRTLADPEQRGTQVWHAARELDDFMSTFGLLPRAWQVQIALHERPDGRAEVPEAARVKLQQVVRDVLDQRPLECVAERIAGAIAEAILEERRQAERFVRYHAVYGAYDSLREQLRPVVMEARADGSIVKLTEEQIAALERASGEALAAGSMRLIVDPSLLLKRGSDGAEE
jgi:hypothetical protein